MAATRIADVIVPEIMTKIARAEIVNSLDFLKTGLATKDYENVDIKEGGHFANVPFYDEFSGDDEVITDDTSMTPQAMTTDKDIGVVCHRGKSWANRDLAKIASGSDPNKEMGRQLGTYWSKRLRTACINVLNGNFNTSGPLATTHKYDVAVATGTAITITESLAMAAMQKIGDAMNDFDVVVMHSKVYVDMVNRQMVTFNASGNTNNPLAFDPSNLGRYLGKEIIVSDDVPVDTTTANFYEYTTYFCKKGCMYLGMQKELQTEYDRDILALEDVMSSHIHFVPHLRLSKWGVTTTNPTNAQLATVTNWTKVANSDKDIVCVALVTN